ncbi:uncharacterized protein LOC100178467 [Ciona intestinalis]
MWSLVSTENNQVKRLLANRVYTFGRKDVDFIIANDSSVSRKHGTIKVADEESSNEPCLTVSDCSKFGTFYSKNEPGNEQHLVFNKITGEVQLKQGDCLRIGVLKSIFKIEHKPLLIVTSSMSSVLQEKLREKVTKLGGKLTTNWQTGVTHLAMQSILLNVKVTQALACACPIVSEKYFSKLLKSVETNEVELPNTNDFLPDISEQGLDKRECSFQVNVERKNIFRDKTVVFLSHKQMKRLGTSCSYSGATVCLVSDPKCTDEKLVDENTIVVRCADNAESQVIDAKKLEKLQRQFRRKQLRFIQEHEIGLSLLYCSTDVYCNPSFDLEKETTFSQRPIPGSTFSQNMDHPQQVESRQEVEDTNDPNSLFISCIPETMKSQAPDTFCSLDVGMESEVGRKKRPHEDHCTDEIPSKHQKTNSPPKHHPPTASPKLIGDTAHCSKDATHRQTPELPFKVPKPQETIAQSVENIAQSMLGSSMTSNKKKSKPPPKKKRISAVSTTPVQLTIPNNKPTMDHTTTKEHIITSTKVASNSDIALDPAPVSPIHHNLDEIPDSCIEDDSLWTSSMDLNQKNDVLVVPVKTEYIAPEISVDQNSERYVDPDLIDSERVSESQHCEPTVQIKPKQELLVVKKEKISQPCPQVNKDKFKNVTAGWTDPKNAPTSDYCEVIPDYPSSDLSKVVQVSLIVTTSTTRVTSKSNAQRNTKNYKCFRKVYPTYMDYESQNNTAASLEPPKIIGGRDLFKHENKISKDTNLEDWAMLNERDDDNLNPFGS